MQLWRITRMPDIADADYDDNIELLIAHQTGMCDEYCQYCWEEEKQGA